MVENHRAENEVERTDIRYICRGHQDRLYVGYAMFYTVGPQGTNRCGTRVDTCYGSAMFCEKKRGCAEPAAKIQKSAIADTTAKVFKCSDENWMVQIRGLQIRGLYILTLINIVPMGFFVNHQGLLSYLEPVV